MKLTNLLQRNLLNIGEVNVLINQFNQPLMLIDSERNLVISINSTLIELTSYTYEELRGNPVDSILIKCNPNSKEKDDSVCIVRKNRSPIEVSVKSIDLDNNNRWKLLEISLPSQVIIENYAQINAFLNLFLEVVAPSFDKTQDEYISSVIKIVSEQFDIDYLSIYQTLESEENLKRINYKNEQDIFPEILPISEYERIDNIEVWRPGKRVISEIHKIARLNSLAEVISIPYGISEKKAGLFVIGKLEKLPDKNIYEMIEAFVNGFSRTIASFQEREKLLGLLENQETNLITLEQLLENIEIGTLVINQSLRIEEINSFAEQLLGYSRWEIQNLLIDEIFTDPENVKQLIFTAFNEENTQGIDEINIIQRNGCKLYAQIKIIPMRLKGKEKRLLMLVTDISEKIKFINQIEKLEHKATLGDLIAIFAHEVRNPINNIVTGLQLLTNLYKEDGSHNEAVQRMQNDCIRLNHLMESILSYSRPLKIVVGSININDLIKRIMEKWEAKMKKKGIKPFFHQGKDIPLVLGDMRSLEQIFTNLISNAVNAMDNNGGTLAVHVEKSMLKNRGKAVLISISDTGTGISDEIKKHLFEPFISLNPKGTGLGLAITKRIVNAHNGEINVDTFPGGTVFKIILPAYKGD